MDFVDLCGPQFPLSVITYPDIFMTSELSPLIQLHKVYLVNIRYFCIMGIVQKEGTEKQLKAAIEATLKWQGPGGQDDNDNDNVLMDSPFSL